MTLLDFDLKLSTANNPQTNGQTERVNQTLEQYLRCHCSYKQDDWVNLLPLTHYAYNSTTKESSKVSTFYANYVFDNLDLSRRVINSKLKTT
jgi:hypothetical protein